MIQAKVVDEILAQTYGQTLLAAGFSESGRRRWVRARVPFAHDLFEVQALKGATFSPRWGLSLVYVPHVRGGRLRWHRTAKAAVLDVTIDPIDTQEPFEIEINPLVTFDEPDVFRHNANARCGADYSNAEATFTDVATLSELARLFEHLRAAESPLDVRVIGISRALEFEFCLGHSTELCQRESIGNRLLDVVVESEPHGLLGRQNASTADGYASDAYANRSFGSERVARVQRSVC